MPDAIEAMQAALSERFGENFAIDPQLAGLPELASIAAHRVQRRYDARPIAPSLLRLLCACALSAPSKSDLQQADILIVRDAQKRKTIADLLPDMPWVGAAPEFLVFLANGRRVPALFKMRNRPYPNDHLDLFFNASVDAGLVLMNFIRAAEAAGLGCCPISVIRDHAAKVSALLELPDKVIPIAGLCVGWPAEEGGISPRLPLALTVHEDRFDEGDLAAQIDGYDRRRHAQRPFRNQRDVAKFGEAEFYGWSEDKARQYAVPQRSDFGAFVRGKDFHLD
ncbi:MAG TPA: nitroreductase family protein [Pseudolabrys sp.]|jgi:nitroreductase/FMN reductase [NAD(P)H]|nr:nitroreductase family protein [Pseudolabrys sp.]